NKLSLLMDKNTSKKKHRSFVTQYAIVNNKRQITALKIDPLIKRWYAEKQDFERNQINNFWYGWEELKQFHKYHQNGETIKMEMREKNLFIEEHIAHAYLTKIQ